MRIMPILQDGKSLGAWSALAWDPRRPLPPYAAAFVEEIQAYSRRSFPGRELNAVAPPVPLPPDHAGTPGPRRR